MQRSYAGTCNPSLLSGFAFCWHICFKRPPFFISSAWLAHTHPWTNTYTRLTSHLYTLFPLPVFFPLAVHPVNSYVLHGFTHKLCLFWLCTVLWLAYYPTLFLKYLYSDWCVFHVCKFYTQWYRSMGAKAPLPTSPPIGCMYWINVFVRTGLFVPVSQYLSHHDVPCLMSHIPLHASIYTLTHSYRHNTHMPITINAEAMSVYHWEV